MVDHQRLNPNSLLYCLGPLRKISSQSVHNFQSNVVQRQTDRQTNTTNNMTSFAKNFLCQGGQYCELFILYSNAQILQHTS